MKRRVGSASREEMTESRMYCTPACWTSFLTMGIGIDPLWENGLLGFSALPVSLIFPNTFVGTVNTWAALPRAVRTNSCPSFFVSHGGKEEALSNGSQMPVHLTRGPGWYPFPTQPTPSQLHPRPGAELGATQPCSATHSSDTSARSSALSSSPSRMTNLRATCRDRKDRPRLTPESHV